MLYLFPGISLHFVAKETYIITILSKFLHYNLKNKWRIKTKLENISTANALQLEAARATPVLFRFNYNAMSILKSLNLSLAVLK